MSIRQQENDVLDEVGLTDAEYLTSQGCDPDSPIEPVVRTNAIGTLERLASMSARAYRS